MVWFGERVRWAIKRTTSPCRVTTRTCSQPARECGSVTLPARGSGCDRHACREPPPDPGRSLAAYEQDDHDDDQDEQDDTATDEHACSYPGLALFREQLPGMGFSSAGPRTQVWGSCRRRLVEAGPQLGDERSGPPPIDWIDLESAQHRPPVAP